MTVVILFVLGMLVGSFLNVVALRWGSKSIVGGRSKCPSCDKGLSWWELIPLLSYVLLRGRCSGCHKRISSRYVLVEVLSGIVFVSVYLVVGLTTYYLLLTTVFSIYIVISLYDYKHKIIPDALSYSAIVLALIYRFLLSGEAVDWIAGLVLFVLFGGIWLLSRGRAMGFGDAKLVLSVGLLLGGANGFSAVVLAFWIGAGFALALIGVNKLGFIQKGKGLKMKSEIPFAPFICLGAWISFIFNLDILYVGLF